MNLNPLIEQAKADRHPDDANCCKNNVCRTCGAHVSGYNANASLRAARPEANDDWWMACDNADCVHAYGEEQGVSNSPDWVSGNGEAPPESSTDRMRREILGCTPPEPMVERMRKHSLYGDDGWRKEAIMNMSDDDVSNLHWELGDAGAKIYE
jgi:hypothetical protein